MKTLPEMIAALKTSVSETVAAARDDRDDSLAKSIDQFARAVQPLLVEPEAAGQTEHVAMLGAALGNLVTVIQAVDAGQFQKMAGGAAPAQGKMELLKTAVDLCGIAVNLMAAEQATPVGDGEDPEAEGLGLAKVATEGGEIMLKHSLSEAGMAWIADPETAIQEGVEAALSALQLLNVDVTPLIKAFDGEEDEEQEDGEEGEGAPRPKAEDGQDELADQDGGEAFGENPLADLARLGVLITATCDAIRQQSEQEGVDPAEMEALNAMAEHGAYVTVQADHLLQMDVGDQEGGEEGAPEGGEAPAAQGEDEEPAEREREMALAAKSSEMAKRARERLGLNVKAVEPAAAVPGLTKAAPAPEPKLPTLQATAVDKLTDQGLQEQGDKIDAMAKSMMGMTDQQRAVALTKMALKGAPIPVEGLMAGL